MRIMINYAQLPFSGEWCARIGAKFQIMSEVSKQRQLCFQSVRSRKDKVRSKQYVSGKTNVHVIKKP